MNLKINNNNNSKKIKEWSSIKEAADCLNLDNGSICKCLKGKMKTCGGYKWGYADEYERIPFKVFDLEIYKKKIV